MRHYKLGEAEKPDLQQRWPELWTAGQELSLCHQGGCRGGQDEGRHLRRVRGHLPERPEVGGWLCRSTVWGAIWGGRVFPMLNEDYFFLFFRFTTGSMIKLLACWYEQKRKVCLTLKERCCIRGEMTKHGSSWLRTSTLFGFSLDGRVTSLLGAMLTVTRWSRGTPPRLCWTVTPGPGKAVTQWSAQKTVSRCPVILRPTVFLRLSQNPLIKGRQDSQITT